jgi:hypothetical protein
VARVHLKLVVPPGHYLLKKGAASHANGLSLTTGSHPHVLRFVATASLFRFQLQNRPRHAWVPHAQAGVHGFRAAKYINNERQTSSLGGCEGQGRECAVRGGGDTYATETRRPAMPLQAVALRNTAYKGAALYQTPKPIVCEGGSVLW